MWVYCSAVRIGRGFKSSLSERGSYTGTGVQNVTGEWREQMENSYAQRHSNVSESWEKNEKHYVQRHSKVSEWLGKFESSKVLKLKAGKEIAVGLKTI